MKIVIVSDIHGNIEALEALSEPYDELWVLGDLVNYGPDPEAVIEFVRSKAALVVRGNHDHAVAYGEDAHCSPAFREMAAATCAFTKERLSDTHKEYLRQLPLEATRTVGGVRFRLCHATPSDALYRYCPGDPALWSVEAQAVDTDVLLVGHTHQPFVFDLRDRVVANPGSLGQPKHGTPKASYAIWQDGKIELRSIYYPVDETIRKIQAMPVPDHVRRSLTGVLRSGGLTGVPPVGAPSNGAIIALSGVANKSGFGASAIPESRPRAASFR